MATGTTRVNKTRASTLGTVVTPGTADDSSARTMKAYSSSDATSEYSVRMDDRTTVIVECGGTGTVLTIVTPFDVDGLALADSSITIAANQTRAFGHFDTAYYADDDGDVQFRATDAARLTISAWI